MKIFRMPAFADSTGDAIPFHHDGKYHIFNLTPPKGTTVYPARLRTSWNHAVSENLVDWTQLETAIHPGEGDAPDADGVWTGSVAFGEGEYHAFYTGYALKQRFQQTICHATSKDGVVWTKNPANPIITPLTDRYEELDWRDPYIFYNEDDRLWWLLISARRKDGPAPRRGCVILYRSKDLKKWDYYGPIYEPYHTNCPECPEMYKIGDNWYLSYSRFSEFGNTIYRMAKSPFGPWRAPKYDGIGGRRFYAAKSMADDDGRRFYFAWAHDRAQRSDNGEWYWGGEFCVPHEVTVEADGELAIRMPREIVASFDKPLAWSYKPAWGNSRPRGGRAVEVDSVGTLSYGFFDVKDTGFLMSCKIRVNECSDHFGLVLKSDPDIAKCLILMFERGMQRVSLMNMPMNVDPFWQQSCTNIVKPRDPGPDGPRVAERPFAFKNGDVIDLKVVVDRDMVEIFAGEKAAFTYRSYEKPDHEIGILVQDANVEYYDIDFRK